MYRPYHLIGLELGVSIANVVFRGEPTGATESFRGDAVATAKRVLHSGEKLDGEGGYTVYGRLMPAADSLAREAVPIGLAHGIALRRSVEAGRVVKWSDVVIDTSNEAIRVRQEMEAMFRKELGIETPARSASACRPNIDSLYNDPRLERKHDQRERRYSSDGRSGRLVLNSFYFQERSNVRYVP